MLVSVMKETAQNFQALKIKDDGKVGMTA